MSIEFNCTECGRTLKVKEELAGMKVRCPECGAVLVALEPVLDAEEVVLSAQSAEDVYAMATPEPAAQPAEKRRPCPMCGEMILTDAVKCRFCGEIFDETLKRAQEKQHGNPSDADLGVGEWVAAILCSSIACIVGIVWMIQGKPKGTKMVVVSLIFVVFWAIVNLGLQGMKGR
jgi:predicted RNA-binding Zn-ribbon protein involved in translation (DUF1610 family)